MATESNRKDKNGVDINLMELKKKNAHQEELVTIYEREPQLILQRIVGHETEMSINLDKLRLEGAWHVELGRPD